MLLVRHAVALPRGSWREDDALRPLDGRGGRQARALVQVLAPFAPARFLSSPAVRCMDTLGPAAAALGLAAESSDDLTEGNGRRALRLVRALLAAGDEVSLCTHGDVIGDVLGALHRDGALLDGDRCEKGSTWVLEPGAGDRVHGRYLPPPA